MRGCAICAFLLLLAAGCSRARQEKPTDFQADPQTAEYASPAVLTGQVLHPEVYPNTREITIILPFLDRDQPQKYVAPIGADGHFSLLLYPYTYRDCSIQTFVDRFVIGPGDSLHVELDFADLTYTHFSGPAARDNDLLAVYMLKYGPIRWPGENGRSEKEFLEAMQMQREQYRERLEEFGKEQHPSEALLAWCRREIDIRYYTQLIDRLHSYRYESQSLHDALQPQSSPFDQQEVLALFDDSIVNSSQFLLAERFKSWTSPHFYKAMKKRGLSNTAAAYSQIIRDSIPNRILAQTMITAEFYQYLVRNDVEAYEAGIEAFNAWVTAPYLRIPIEGYYLEKAAYRRDPSKVSDLILHPEKQTGDRQGISAQAHPFLDLLNGLIREPGHQVLHITLGASWCEPCILQKKGQNRLLEEFKGQALRVISIYMDPEENLRRAEAFLGFPFRSEAYFLTDEQTDDLNKQILKTHGIPYFLLVDKEGRIVDYGGHLRLENGWYEQTAAKIRTLLEEP